jgi:hypothetical protein
VHRHISLYFSAWPGFWTQQSPWDFA